MCYDDGIKTRIIPKDEFTQELDENVRDINKDPQWRKQYMDLAYKMKEIRLEGREEGKIEGMISLVRKQKINIESAAEELQMPVDEFKQLMIK